MTSEAARVMGLKDRGVLAVGKRADVNVFDLDRLTQLQPEIVHNFPRWRGALHAARRAATRRRWSTARSTCSTTQSTGARAGMVLRHGH